MGRTGLFLSVLSILVSSCISENEGPLIEEVSIEKELSGGIVSGGENLRKGDFYRYQEKFSNSIFQVDSPNGFMLPGTGVGNATFMGKSISFINQVVTGETTTEGVPVTLIFGDALAEMGLIGIPDYVHSITMDKKGNALFFSSGTNYASPISETRTEFEAEVTIVGGIGLFENASGTGKVTGFYNPTNGKGESAIVADLMFK